MSTDSTPLPAGSGVAATEGAQRSAVEPSLGAEPVSTDLTDAQPSRFNLPGRSLREHAARGMLINTAFLTGVNLLTLLRGFVIAAFLTAEDYGIWGILVIAIGTLAFLTRFGFGDKYIQQDEADQELAFQKAFTLELTVRVVTVMVLAAAVPLVALVYGESELIAPGLVVLLALPAAALQAPLWVYYRRMQFVRQRTLQAADPVVGFIVALALAIAGFGFWALVAGVIAGAWASALIAIWFSPYRIRLRYDRSTVRRYWSFSWPLFVAGAAGLVLAQSAMFATEAHLGLAAAGVLALSANITRFTERVDQIVGGTLYPAICAVKDRREVLQESFVKANRLALMWALPFGLAVSLFASDLVGFGIGEQWRPAVPLLQIAGVVAGLAHIGFNWESYFRARGETRPIAVASTAATVAFLLGGIPLLLLYDLRGLALGLGLQALAHLLVRAWYLQRLFHGFVFLGHAVRALLPSLPAVAAVLLLRLAESGERTLEMALAELLIYLAITAASTWALERPLLREAIGYLRGRRRVAPAA